MLEDTININVNGGITNSDLNRIKPIDPRNLSKPEKYDGAADEFGGVVPAVKRACS